MPHVMKKALLPLLLALGACQGFQSTDSSASGPTGTSTVTSSTGQSDQVKALQTIGSTATTASQVGIAMGNPAVAGAGAAIAAIAEAASAATVKSVAAPKIDPSKEFEYADIYISTDDPDGMGRLVPYLLQPKDWMLISFDMITVNYNHYRFMKVSTGIDRAMPTVDIFKPRSK